MVGMQTLTRKSVPLDADELALAHAIQSGATPERAAIEALVGPLPVHVSEAQAISTLIALGAARVKEETIRAGYAALAATLDDEDRQFAAAQRARRARMTD